MSDANVTTRLHNWHHKDYAEAGRQINQALGDISDIEIAGRQVLVAVYVRPNVTNGGVMQSVSAQKEDVWQGKIVLLLKAGPDAFVGDDSYRQAMWGNARHPQAGDWLVVRAIDGLPISLKGDNAERPQGKDFRGDPIDIYDWDGWPCRFLPDDAIIARVSKPHSVV